MGPVQHDKVRQEDCAEIIAVGGRFGCFLSRTIILGLLNLVTTSSLAIGNYSGPVDRRGYCQRCHLRHQRLQSNVHHTQ